MVKTSISKKTTWFVVIAVSTMTICLLAMGFLSVWKLRFDTVGQRQKQDADIFAGIIAQQIDREVNSIKAYLSSLWWREAVKEANLRYLDWKPEAINEYMAQADQRWIAAADNPLIQEILGSRMSQRLKALVEQDIVIAEIFLTDQYGGLVAASGKTSDYYQADESWWQSAYNHGKGDIFLGGVEMDESSGKISSAIAAPFKDQAGSVFGVAKAVLDIDVFFQPLMKYKFGETGHVALLDDQGGVIYDAGLKAMSKSGLSGMELSRLFRTKNGFAIIKVPYLKTMAIVAVSKIKSPFLEANGINWVVVVTQAQNEVFLPLYGIFGLGLILALIISFLIMLVMQSTMKGIFISPLQKVQDGMQRFSDGHLDYKIELETGDEIQELADTFNKMTGQLQKTTVSRDYLDNIIESMTDSLIVIDSDSKIVTVNQATCTLLGYAEKELIGKDASFLFPEEETIFGGTEFKHMLKEVVLKNYEINYKTKDGRKIPVFLSAAVLKRKYCQYGGAEEDCPVFKEKGEHCEKILGVVCIVKDVTERKKLEEEARKRLRELEVFYKVSMGREERIIELKKEVERLKQELAK